MGRRVRRGRRDWRASCTTCRFKAHGRTRAEAEKRARKHALWKGHRLDVLTRTKQED